MPPDGTSTIVRLQAVCGHLNQLVQMCCLKDIGRVLAVAKNPVDFYLWLFCCPRNLLLVLAWELLFGQLWKLSRSSVRTMLSCALCCVRSSSKFFSFSWNILQFWLDSRLVVAITSKMM